MLRKNFYIEILKYVDIKCEFTEDEIFKDLDFSEEERQLFVGIKYNKTMLENTGRKKDVKNYGTELTVFTISPEGKFRLEEYMALDEARKSSKKAIEIATISLIISSLLALLAIASIMTNLLPLCF